jgi:hypothetical protein
MNYSYSDLPYGRQKWFFGFALVLRPIATYCYKNRYIGFGLALVLWYQVP